MRNDAHQRTVSCYQCRSQIRHRGIFHAAVWKRRRHHQQIEFVPNVLAEQGFRPFNHLVHVGKFPCRLLDRFRFGKNPRALADRRRDNVADGERKQVRRNRMRHFKLENSTVAVACLSFVQSCHCCSKPLWHAQLRRVRETHTRCILAGEYRARKNGLALTEHERMTLPRRLLGIKPLQSSRLRRRRIPENEITLAGRTMDRQHLSEKSRIVKFPFQITAFNRVNLLDLQITSVEDKLIAERTVEMVSSRPTQDFSPEVHAQIKINVADTGTARIPR